jgi:aryl-alcohol dehydrogenase-like predicted oxidoreductase
VEESLRVFGLDVIDLLFLHDPVAMTPDQYEPAIAEMHRLRDRGLVLNLGMGGQYAPDFEPHALSGSFSHFMGFNRYNVIRQEANAYVYPKLRSEGIRIWQASPLYMGLLGNKYEDYMAQRPEWIPQADFAAAASLHQACTRDGLDMTGLALNFVFRSPSVDRMVLGASRPEELSRSLEWLQDHRLASAADALLEAGLNY